MNEISKETIDKAEELIKFITGEKEEKPIEKAEASEEDSEKEEESEKEEVDELAIAKAKIDELAAEIETLKKAKELDIKKSEDLPNNGEGDGQPLDELVKASVDTALEAVSEKFEAVGDLYLANKERSDEMDSAIEELKKSFETEINALKKQVEELGNQPMTGRRGIITKAAVDRFKEEHGKDAEVYSLSQNRKQLVDKLYALSGQENAGEDGAQVDHQLVKGFMDVEIAGGFSDPTLPKRLQRDFNILVVN